jgi:peroxiredoxin
LIPGLGRDPGIAAPAKSPLFSLSESNSQPKVVMKLKSIAATVLLLVATLSWTHAVENAVTVGSQAPDFKITDQAGKEVNLADLTKQGPVLVRLTCGCLGCDQELPYFQALHEAYKAQGLTSLAVFAEPDEKFAAYAKTKKLEMRYALDPKRESWKVFGAKVMPTNLLIDKGGKIVAITSGCNPEGLKAMTLGAQAATLVKADEVDLKKTVVKPAAKVEKAK